MFNNIKWLFSEEYLSLTIFTITIIGIVLISIIVYLVVVLVKGKKEKNN